MWLILNQGCNTCEKLESVKFQHKAEKGLGNIERRDVFRIGKNKYSEITKIISPGVIQFSIKPKLTIVAQVMLSLLSTGSTKEDLS